jgi:hypothetical protein
MARRASATSSRGLRAQPRRGPARLAGDAGKAPRGRRSRAPGRARTSPAAERARTRLRADQQRREAARSPATARGARRRLPAGQREHASGTRRESVRAGPQGAPRRRRGLQLIERGRHPPASLRGRARGPRGCAAAAGASVGRRRGRGGSQAGTALEPGTARTPARCPRVRRGAGATGGLRGTRPWSTPPRARGAAPRCLRARGRATGRSRAPVKARWSPALARERLQAPADARAVAAGVGPRTG